MENELNIRKKRNNFVMIDNAIFENPNLSWKAKGVLGYLLSRPDGWKVNVSDLIKRSTDGEKAVYSALKELRENGYYKKIPVREKGMIVKWISYIFEEPQKIVKIEESEIKTLETRSESLLADFLQVENLHVENRGHSNTNYTNTNYTNTDVNGMVHKSSQVESEEKEDKTKSRQDKNKHIQQIHNSKTQTYEYYKKLIEEKTKINDLKRLHSSEEKQYFRELCDIFIDIIARNMADTTRTIRINKKEGDRGLWRDKLENVNQNIFMFALNQYFAYNSMNEIKKPEQYILTCLYNAFVDSKLKS